MKACGKPAKLWCYRGRFWQWELQLIYPGGVFGGKYPTSNIARNSSASDRTAGKARIIVACGRKADMVPIPETGRN